MTNRAGFSLVEGLVAVTLLAVAVTALAPLLFLGAHEGTMLGADVERNTAMLESVNELTALTTTELEARVAVGSTVCDTVAAGGAPHERCVSNSEGSTTREMDVQVIVAPLGYGGRTDTVSFTRTKPASGSPFN